MFCFSIGLIFTTGAGEYWLKMFDSFAGTIGLVVVALMETIAVIYIYGHKKYGFVEVGKICELIHSDSRFTEDIYQMTGVRPGIYWQMTWRYIGPVIMTGILISSVLSMILSSPKYSAWNGELVSLPSISC